MGAVASGWTLISCLRSGVDIVGPVAYVFWSSVAEDIEHCPH